MKTSSTLLFLAVFLSAGCDYTQPSADQVESARQEVLQAEAVRETGTPNITNFTERKFMKTLYELRDTGVTTWIYKMNVDGQHFLVGKAVGYPLSAAAQYSSPEKYSRLARSTGAFEWQMTPQAEPNGLFMPSSAEGSWVMLMTTEGPKPYYSEDRLTGSPVRIPGGNETQCIPWGEK